jgi:3-oxoacyl-(acyl-carrier-protein) synthase/pyruvate/2-oxoglutarate dehydrogenase complex dihydrolipoamide acyltransferase (E2) component
MTELRIPQLGEGLTEVHVLRLLKQPGETVQRDEPLYEVETEKATMQIESPLAGRVEAWLVGEGVVAAVGQVVARLAPLHADDRASAGDDMESTRAKVPPRTRAYSRDLGLTPAQLENLALAHRGVLLPEDLNRYAEHGRPAGEARFTDVEVPMPRRALDRAMLESGRVSVPALISAQFDADSLARAAAALEDEAGEAVFATDFAAFAYLAARTAADHPAVRSRRLSEAHRRVYERVHLGIAVALEGGGLGTSVIRDADTLGFAQFAAAYAAGLDTARAGHGTADATVTLQLSHVDSPAAQFAFPVVVAPACGTLFLGARGPAGRHAVLAFDHTVVDGLAAARYLEDLLSRIARWTASDPVAAETRTSSAVRDATGFIDAVRAEARVLLGSDPDPDAPLGQQGLTSRQAVTLAARLNEAHGSTLPATAVWHHPTVRGLAAALADAPRASGTSGGTVRRAAGEPVAIVGAACRLPGAENIEALWELLGSGRDAFRDVPLARLPGFDPAGLGVDPPRLRAGLLERIDTFDAPFFGLSPRAAGAVDPQQRILLELSWNALEHAAIRPDSLAGSRTAVLIGAGGYDYRELAAARGLADGATAVGTLQSYLANRISQFYDFHGPSITVDTACSSALTAVCLAVDALRSGSCDTALAGSASTISNGFNATAYYRAGMLSPSGGGTAFDDQCDGYVRGEGAAVCVLKRLSDAQRDGDPVLTVILGTAVNHGGQAASPTAPNPRAQTSAVRAALRDAGLAAAALGYLEAHGTATPLGDPIEWQALKDALDGHDAAAGPGKRLWVSSVKSYIGHLEGAAGIAGLLSAALVTQRGRVPALAGFRASNHRLSNPAGPLSLADRSHDWPVAAGQAPRTAGVSSFGLGGSNAHVVLQQPPPAPHQVNPPDGTLHAFPLSAERPAALRALAASLATFLADDARRHALDQVAFTLQVARSRLRERRVILARSLPELVDALRALAAGRADPRLLGPGEADGTALLAELGDAGSEVVRAWLSDALPGWDALWRGRNLPSRVPLVPYPFQRTRYWLPSQQPPLPASTPSPPEQGKGL